MKKAKTFIVLLLIFTLSACAAAPVSNGESEVTDLDEVSTVWATAKHRRLSIFRMVVDGHSERIQCVHYKMKPKL